MAGIFGKKKTSDSAAEWTKTGSFVHKPRRGWLHAEDSLREGGVCYAVRYVGCLKVLKSMRTLSYDLRQQVTREAILHVCEASGHHAGKRRKASKNITKVLGDVPNMSHTGESVNLTVSASGIKMVSIDGGKVITRHDMQGISFASGGEKECIDMVGYIAKDDVNGRACHVIDCGKDLSFDVINTVGQAFEIRYKMFLENPPQAMEVPEKFSETIFDEAEEGKYNEIDESAMDSDYAEPRTEGPPGDKEAQVQGTYASLRSSRKDDTIYNKLRNTSNYDVPRPNPAAVASGAHQYETPRQNTVPAEETSLRYDNPSLSKTGSVSSQASSLMFVPGGEYNNRDTNAINTAFYENPIASNSKPPAAPQREDSLEQDTTPGVGIYDNPDSPADVSGKATWATFGDDGDLAPPPPPPLTTNPGYRDYVTPVDSQKQAPPKPVPYAQSKVCKLKEASGDKQAMSALHQREWFHGKITRVESELLLEHEGDFLVRESKSQPGQYVMCGIQNGVKRHLLLVDPQGRVRTKDKVFNSVEELIDYHVNNGLPIISAGTEVTIKNPVIKG